MHSDTKSSLIKLNCAVGERVEKEKTIHPGDNKNDLLIAENGLKGKRYHQKFPI